LQAYLYSSISVSPFCFDLLRKAYNKSPEPKYNISDNPVWISLKSGLPQNGMLEAILIAVIAYDKAMEAKQKLKSMKSFLKKPRYRLRQQVIKMKKRHTNSLAPLHSPLIIKSPLTSRYPMLGKNSNCI